MSIPFVVDCAIVCKLHMSATCKNVLALTGITNPVSSLLQPNDINLVDTAGLNALHLACMQGLPEFVHYLSSFPRCIHALC